MHICQDLFLASYIHLFPVYGKKMQISLLFVFIVNLKFVCAMKITVHNGFNYYFYTIKYVLFKL